MSGSFDKYCNFEQALDKCGEYVTQVRGNSMYPMLRYRRDPVLIRPVSGDLRRYDVAVYNRGDSYVIHRILEVRPDCCIFRGDNCTASEIVPKELILGVVTGFWRTSRSGGTGRFIPVGNGWYRLYSRVWVALNPLDVLSVRLVRRIFACLGRLFR